MILFAKTTGSVWGDLIAYSIIGIVIVLIKVVLTAIVGSRGKDRHDEE